MRVISRFIIAIALVASATGLFAAKPNIVLVMADDQGWGQTGYRNHPALKTPHLDAMAANGLRFERFYAGGPVCSPTRATVLTGRTHDRTGVFDHGYALRQKDAWPSDEVCRLRHRAFWQMAPQRVTRARRPDLQGGYASPRRVWF